MGLRYVGRGRTADVEARHGDVRRGAGEKSGGERLDAVAHRGDRVGVYVVEARVRGIRALRWRAGGAAIEFAGLYQWRCWSVGGAWVVLVIW